MLGHRTLKINGTGEQTRDYVFVDDLCRAAAAALPSDKSGTWNLGTGVETSVNALFDTLAKEFGYTAEAPHTAPPPGEQQRSVLDGSAIRRDFALPPWTPLPQGLGPTAAYFRSLS